MVEDNGIFDLDDVEDISESTRQELNACLSRRFGLRVLRLFNLKDELTIPELVVGFYRKYGEDITKKKMHYAIQNLLNGGYIKKVDSLKRLKKYAKV